ncbi:MAG TPA: TonB-dependent receptor plug domain-containing protein [Chitinophagaceae bacterium]|nr:TonB-dependent receptor plug domain-containing protein [Chitinophagaceae bacterium]
MRRSSLWMLFAGRLLLKGSLCSTILIPTLLFAQQGVISVRARVTSTGGEIAGASVVVKGKSKATTTNTQGEFVLNGLSSDDIIVISAVGHRTREVRAANAGTNITLEISKSELASVVVTGYQRKTATEFAGAATSISVKDIKVPSLATLDRMLQGQVAGVAVQATSSVFGTAPKIRVRGSASISGINEPLWVLDGVPLDAPLNIVPSELYAGNARNLLASALSNVNPEDIEDITVLKDATATAMYGTRAVNGVIVINTKRAVKNSPLRVNYTFNTTLSLKPSVLDFDVLNSKDQIELNQEFSTIYENSLNNFTANNSGPLSRLTDQYNRRLITEQQYREGIRDLKIVNTDWFDALYKNTLLQQHSISLSQGGEKSATRLSFSYYGDPGKTLGENTRRLTANMVNNFQVTKNFNAEVMLKYARRDQKNPGTQVNPFAFARDASRAMRPYDNEGNFEYYKRGYANFNIIDEINNNYINLSSNDITAQLNLDYRITNRLKLTTLTNIRYS